MIKNKGVNNERIYRFNYPKTMEIFTIYDTVDEGLKDIKFLNVFIKDEDNKLRLGRFEATDEEYEELMKQNEE